MTPSSSSVSRRPVLWGLYMAGCAFNFEMNNIQVHQFLAIKPNDEGTDTYPLRPWWPNH